MGFALPLVHWWRGGLGDWSRPCGRQRGRGGGLDQERARPQTPQAHGRGADHHTRLWLVLWLELWFRLVVHRASPETLPRC